MKQKSNLSIVSEQSCHSKICYFEDIVGIQEQIFWLYISMSDTLQVEILLKKFSIFYYEITFMHLKSFFLV